jgi:hypothetical protein
MTRLLTIVLDRVLPCWREEAAFAPRRSTRKCLINELVAGREGVVLGRGGAADNCVRLVGQVEVCVSTPRETQKSHSSRYHRVAEQCRGTSTGRVRRHNVRDERHRGSSEDDGVIRPRCGARFALGGALWPRV